MNIKIPEFCLITLIGSSMSGKTTFANTHFDYKQVLSSDNFREMICGDSMNQSINSDAFESLYFILDKRLKNYQTTIVDATNTTYNDRKKILEIAKANNVQNVAIVINIDESIIFERQKRLQRVKPDKLKKQIINVRKSISGLKSEGYRYVYVLESPEEIDNCNIEIFPMYSNMKHVTGPFDIIGDIHGCYTELIELLIKLGYKESDGLYKHPDNRKLIFLGDLMDRGNQNIRTIELIMNLVKNNIAFCVMGNHDFKFVKKVNDRTTLNNGLDITLKEFDSIEDEDRKNAIIEFINSLRSHYVFDDGNLVVSHAGIKEEYINRSSGKIRSFCLFGETTNEKDQYGYPIRIDWAKSYKGKPMIVYGHIPHNLPYIINNTYNIDTGCCFGNKLTALRYPERELISVDALEEYCEHTPFEDESSNVNNDILKIEDYQNDLSISTELINPVIIKKRFTETALETVSRFTIDPKWLIYLPPTMSPAQTSSLDNYLEYPTEAFKYFRDNNVELVTCQKKHMGSRCIIIVCKNNEVVKKRFNIKNNNDRIGIIYSRTGRKMFDDETESIILNRLNEVLIKSDFYKDFNTDWVILDTELMPWSAKAQGLLRSQYAPVGRAGLDSIIPVENLLIENYNVVNTDPIIESKISPLELLDKYKAKKEALENYIKAYRRYCWTINSIDDYEIAPFHILATENEVHFDKAHPWHLNNINQYICNETDRLFIRTDNMIINVNNPEDIKKATEWWTYFTEAGNEGIVVKPLNYITYNDDKIIQPAIKCRGREYLRIIYGPEYLFEENLTRLKKRSLNRKRELALKEFALGYESLTRFINREPLNRIHECVFGVIALESEPTDPRL